MPSDRRDEDSQQSSFTGTISVTQSSPPSRFEWRGALILFGVLFLGVSDALLISPLLPVIAEDLGTSPGRTGMIVTVYALAAAAFALLLGTASDRLGRKRLISYALVGFTGASLLTYQSSYFSTLLMARLMTGFSAGTLSTLTLSYAADLYPYERRGRAMGVLLTAEFLAFVIGIPAGTLIAGRFGWRSVFLGLAAASSVMLLLTLWQLPPDSKTRRKRAVASVTADFLSFLSKDRLAGILAAFLTSGGLVGFVTYVGAWLAAQDVSVERVGLLLMAAGISAAIASPVAGWISDRIGKKRIIVWANLMLAPLFVVVAGIDWGWPLFIGIGLVGITASARQAPLHALTTEFVSAEVRGSYVAVRNAASQLGIASVVAASAAAFDRSGFGAVAWVALAVTLPIALLCSWMTEPRRTS